MSSHVLLSLAALAALVPAAVRAQWGMQRQDAIFWLLIGAALAGLVARAATALAPAWHTSLSGALWITTAASLAIFIVVAAVARDAWRLAPLLFRRRDRNRSLLSRIAAPFLLRPSAYQRVHAPHRFGEACGIIRRQILQLFEEACYRASNFR